MFQGDEALRPPAFFTIQIQAGVAVFISGDYDSQTVRQNRSDLITISRLHVSLLQRRAQFGNWMDMMEACKGHGRQHEAGSVVGHVHFPGFSSAAESKIQIDSS